VSTSTLTGRAHGANGRRATSGSSIDICPRIDHNLTCFTAVLSAAPLYSLRCLIRSSHICIAMVMLHAGLKPERTLSLFFPRQFCSLNFLITFDIFLCTFLGRYWPAVSVVRHGYTIINSINVQFVIDCGEHRV
jgi:hypothetical protein